MAPGAAALREAGAVRLVIGAVGLGLIGTGGVLFLLSTHRFTELVSAGLWLLGPPVLTDLLVMPIATVAGRLVERRVSGGWQGPVVAALVGTVFVLLVGWPFVSGLGRHPDNPSLLDRHYLLGAAVCTALVWAACLVLGIIRHHRPRRGERLLE